MIQAIGRGYIARAYCRKIHAVVPRLEKAAASRDVDIIDKALADYARVVGSFAGLVPSEFAVVRRCKRIRTALREWERLSCEVDVLAQRDLSTDDSAFEQLKDCVWAMELLLDEPGSEWHMQMWVFFAFCRPPFGVYTRFYFNGLTHPMLIFFAAGMIMPKPRLKTRGSSAWTRS